MSDPTSSPTVYHVPRSVMQTSRLENEWELEVHVQPPDGQDMAMEPLELPSDLHGYVFTVGALFQSEDDPQDDGTALYTGDGMVYRVGFENGKATLKTRIAKTPCYYADLATQRYLALNAKKPQSWFAQKHPIFSYFGAFRDGGQSRYSLLLGARNQLNTAFLRTKDHLLVTIDAGRPYELDPDTMELLEPVGSTKDWVGMLPAVSNFSGNGIFDVFINPAHPVADLSRPEPGKDEFFTANYSTGYNGKFSKPVNRVLDWIGALRGDRPGSKEQFGRFTHLIHYQFGNSESDPIMERWQLVLPNGNPVLVEQSLHQLAITEDYIVLADIAFKMEFSQIFSPFFTGFLKLKFFKKFDWLGSILYSIFLHQIKPLPFSNVYIVKRKDLEKEMPTVTAQKVKIPIEISHFAADYINPNGKITLHIGHSNGWDVTECLTHYDKPVKAVTGESNLRPELEGMMSGTMDLGYLGRYIIDAATGTIEHTELFKDDKSTWSPSVYTHRDLYRDNPAELAKTVKSMYWMSWGFSWEIISQRIYDAYKDDDRRVIAIKDLPKPNENKPVTLLRFDTESMQVADSYHFPPGYFACSPQFVPSSSPVEGSDKSTQGYIVCLVLFDDENGKPSDEFWVFHADSFNNKPVYRLKSKSEPSLNLALTLHTTWLDSIEKAPNSDQERQARRKKSVEADYDKLIENKSGIIKELFHKIVYPYFIRQVSEDKTETLLGCQPHCSSEE